MIVLILRTYSVLRSRLAVALGVAAASLLIAGCGSGGSAPPSTGSSTTAAPGNTFDAQLADQRSQSAAANAGGLAASQSAPVTPPASKPSSKRASAVKPVVHPAPVVTRTQIVVRHGVTRTRTVVKVITKTVTRAPNVPAGAFMPSSHPALAQTTFTVAGGNIGCAFANGGVRCDIHQRIWAPPAQPSNCSGSWGNALGLQSLGASGFVCAGKAVASANADVVPDGWDDKVGKITCQVRSFGVDCFSTSRRGFIVSRTGYTLY